MLRCRLLGHRYRFAADGHSMVWRCDRECGVGGRKDYPTAAAARRYAAALDRADSDSLGTRAPLIGLLPLRVARLIRGRRS